MKITRSITSSTKKYTQVVVTQEEIRNLLQVPKDAILVTVFKDKQGHYNEEHTFDKYSEMLCFQWTEEDNVNDDGEELEYLPGGLR